MFKTSATFGVFDIVHKGHIKMIEEIFRMSESLTIVLMNDNKVSDKKGKYPIYKSSFRKKMLEKKLYTFVENKRLHIIIGKSNPVTDLIEINPEIVFLGYDQTFQGQVEGLGYETIKFSEDFAYNPDQEKSSLIRERIKK